MQREELLARQAGRPANALDRPLGRLEALAGQRLPGRELGRRDGTAGGERPVLLDLPVQPGLRRPERIDLRPERRRARLERLGFPRRRLEHLGRLAGRRRRRTVDAEDRVEPPLSLLGLSGEPGRLGEALETRSLAIGRGAGAVQRLLDRAERGLAGLPDLLEGAADLRLAFQPEPDRDVGGRHPGCPLGSGRLRGRVGRLPIGRDHDRLDLGQRVDQEGRERPHGVGERQDGREVEGVDASHHGPDLTGGAADHRPGEQPVGRSRRVLVIGASGASRRAGGAVALATLEVPAREGGQPFFSASCARAGPT